MHTAGIRRAAQVERGVGHLAGVGRARRIPHIANGAAEGVRILPDQPLVADVGASFWTHRHIDRGSGGQLITNCRSRRLLDAD